MSTDTATPAKAQRTTLLIKLQSRSALDAVLDVIKERDHCITAVLENDQIITDVADETVDILKDMMHHSGLIQAIWEKVK
jgi:hypothetical protein